MIGSHFDSFKPHSECYNHPHLKMQHPHYALLIDRLTRPLNLLSIPVIFTLLDDCPGLSYAWHSPQSRINSDTVCNASVPTRAGTLTKNNFKNHRRTPQITTNLSDMLCPHSYTTWETCQENTYHKISPQQVSLTVKFLKLGFSKRKVYLW